MPRTVEATTEETETQPSKPDYGREAWRVVKRCRRQFLPLAAIAATYGVGAYAATLTWPNNALPVAAGIVAAAGAYGYAHTHAGQWDRTYALAAAVYSGIVQIVFVTTGADGFLSSLTLLGGCALAMPWWVKHCEPDPDVTAENNAFDTAQTAAPPAADTGERVRLWNEHLAEPKGALPGSSIRKLRGFDYGWKATVELPVGKHWHEVMGARKSILSVYDLPDGRVFPEPVPGESVRQCRLTVLTSDPLQTIRHWSKPGLDAKQGTAPLMTTADGETLSWRFWWPGQGAAHGLVSGVNGSGKTKVLEVPLTEALTSDRVVPFIIDGGEGASLPQWQSHVAQFAENPTDARKVLNYLLRLMDIRRPVLKEQRRNGGGSSLEPAPDMPLLLCVIDEAHKLLMTDDETNNKDVRRMCEKLTQEGRKFGISLVLSTQVPSAAQLGGSTVLRDQLKGGTVVGLRVTERTSGNMITSGAPMPEGLHELPAEFPDGTPTKGLGYVLTSRMIRARSLLIAGPDEQPAGMFRDTPLDADCAGERGPVLDGGHDGEDDGELEPSQPDTRDHGGDAAVLHALAEGCAKNPIAIMQATGLSMSQARAALKQVDA